MRVDGIRYLTANELLSELGISRQTLWRWRQDGKIPLGHRFRDRRLLFSEGDVEAIRQHANRVEPAAVADTSQMKLFGDGRPEKVSR